MFLQMHLAEEAPVYHKPSAEPAYYREISSDEHGYSYC